MKKFSAFVLSFGLASVCFLLAAAVVVGAALLRSELDTENKNAYHPPYSSSQSKGKTAVLLAVFSDGGTVFASKIEASFTDGTVTAEALSLPDELVETLNTDGVFPFLGQCFAEFFDSRQKYIVFDGKILSKITDIYGGLVYNNGVGEILLTGSQAVKALTKENFSAFCRQLGEKLLQKNATEGFRLLANTTLNNLSYPQFFEMQSP